MANFEGNRFIERPFATRIFVSSSHGCRKCQQMNHFTWECTRSLNLETIPVSGSSSWVAKQRCYNCGIAGHKSRECRFPKTKPVENFEMVSSTQPMLSAVHESPQRNFDNRICFNCNVIGHISRNCPKIVKNQELSGFKSNRIKMPLAIGRPSRNKLEMPHNLAEQSSFHGNTCKHGFKKCHITCNCSNSNLAVNPEGDAMHLSGPSQYMQTDIEEGGDTRSCFNCGQTGHFYRNCPLPKREASTFYGRNVNQRIVTCFNCGIVGHVIRHCDQPFKDSSISNRFKGNKPGPTMEYHPKQ